MKTIWSLLVALPLSAAAQDIVPPEKAREIAGQLNRLYGELKDAAFVSKPDVERPHAVSGGKVGIVAIPERGLESAPLRDVGPDAIPVGVLWFRGLLPTRGGIGAIDTKQVRNITVTDGRERVVLHAFHLVVRQGDRGRPELHLHGIGKEPVAKVRLLPLPSRHDTPIELDAHGGDGDGAILVVSLVGKWQGELPVRLHEADPSEKAVELTPSPDADKAVQAGHAVMPHLNDFPFVPARIVGAPDQAVIFEAGETAALVVPHSRIDLSKVVPGQEVPVGQLWLKGLLPEVAGRAARVDQIKTATIRAKDRDVTLPQFLLTAGQDEKGTLRLRVYSAAKTALLNLVLSPEQREQRRAVELSGRQDGERRGVLTLKIGSTHTAELPVLATR